MENEKKLNWNVKKLLWEGDLNIFDDISNTFTSNEMSCNTHLQLTHTYDSCIQWNNKEEKIKNKTMNTMFNRLQSGECNEDRHTYLCILLFLHCLIKSVHQCPKDTVWWLRKGEQNPAKQTQCCCCPRWKYNVEI